MVTLEIACAMHILILVESNLLKDIVLARDPLFLLQEQVVGGCHLIMFVILHINCRLLKIFAIEMLLECLNKLGNDGDPIFADNHSLHLNTS